MTNDESVFKASRVAKAVGIIRSGVAADNNKSERYPRFSKQEGEQAAEAMRHIIGEDIGGGDIRSYDEALDWMNNETFRLDFIDYPTYVNTSEIDNEIRALYAQAIIVGKTDKSEISDEIAKKIVPRIGHETHLSERNVFTIKEMIHDEIDILEKDRDGVVSDYNEWTKRIDQAKRYLDKMIENGDVFAIHGLEDGLVVYEAKRNLKKWIKQKLNTGKSIKHILSAGLLSRTAGYGINMIDGLRIMDDLRRAAKQCWDEIRSEDK